jgi:hypothetical protein
MFQNTFLVYAQKEQASYLHYRAMSKSKRRRTFNNIFVAVNPDTDSDSAITFLPSPGSPAEIDGNLYFRIGFKNNALFRYLEYCFKEHPACPQVNIPSPPATPLCPEDPTNDRKCGKGKFDNFVALRGDPDDPNTKPSLLFLHKQVSDRGATGFSRFGVTAAGLIPPAILSVINLSTCKSRLKKSHQHCALAPGNAF